HRGVARFKRDRAVASQILVAVEDMLQVQPRHREERLRIGAVRESMHAVVARAMPLVALVVANHRREVADLECFTRHGTFSGFSSSRPPAYRAWLSPHHTAEFTA